MTLAERIARAMYERKGRPKARGHPPKPRWEDANKMAVHVGYLRNAHAALEAIEAGGYEIVKIKAPLTPEEVASITGITDLMRGGS